MKRWVRIVPFILILVGSVLVVGCASDDQVSTRPWNTPKSWENGLPSALTEGR